MSKVIANTSVNTTSTTTTTNYNYFNQNC